MTDDTPRILRWADPPPRGRSTGRRDWNPVADELRRHEGRWAVVHESSSKDAEARVSRGIGNGIATATLTAFRPAGSFEAQTRKTGDVVVVYARFIGLPEGETP